MTAELHRMLAEGPRVAPELQVATGGSVVAPGSVAGTQGGAREGRVGQSRAARAGAGWPGGARRTRGTKAVLGRLWLPVLLAALVVSTSAGHGHAWVVPLVFAAFAAFAVWRRR